MYNELLGSFENADRVFVSNVYAAGEKVREKFSTQSLAKDIQDISKIPSESFDDPVNNIEKLRISLPNAPTILLTVGAGNIRTVGEKLAGVLNHENKKVLLKS